MTRSIMPVPATLSLADVHRLDAVRERLCHALRMADTLTDMRAYVAELASDIEVALSPARTLPPPADCDAVADTIRAPVAPWDDESAPSTPRGSQLGEEYGV